MAIDSALKRLSAIGLGLPWRSQYPLPDGTINSADRAVSAYQYGGIGALVLTPMYPGDATFTRLGPGDATFTRVGPGAISIARRQASG